MPRVSRRSQAARRRVEAAQVQRISIPKASSDFVGRHGTGHRHKVNQWPTSEHTGLSHKLVIPDGSLEKKLVLLIGASHSRSFAYGIVQMKQGCIGVMSTPGADADQLRKEVEEVVLPRDPDAACVVAPSNNLTASINHEEAGRVFEMYLWAVRERCTKVFCIGMIPRLTESRGKQELFQQEYHRRSAKLSSIAEDFPLNRVDLWCYDGVSTISDNKGMRILSDRIWVSAYQFLELSAPKPQVQSRAAPPYKPRFVPRVVMKGVERVPPPPPPEWTTGRYGRKRSHSGESESLSDSPKKRVVPDEIDGTPVVLKECYIPLSPVRFSPDMLVAMEKVSPLAVADVHTGNEWDLVANLVETPIPIEVTLEVSSSSSSASSVIPCVSVLKMLLEDEGPRTTGIKTLLQGLKESLIKSNLDLDLALTDIEKKLCKYFERVEIKGKRDKKVPILLTPDMVSSIQMLGEGPSNIDINKIKETNGNNVTSSEIERQ
ncbi:uncharacterized protein LOC142368767 [Odontesthes bonariensis]|uniref:uncharacterized protein LOC142368767 n=1 Tax=Odontesthes bonariensis TaxID=219752 RepID=UPI003F582C12